MSSTAEHMRARRKVDNWPPPRAVSEHMPFIGHRSVGEIEAQREACRRAAAATNGNRAKEYGFDPESL